MTQQRATAVTEVHQFRSLSGRYDSLLFTSDEDVSRSLDVPWGQPMAADWVPLRAHWSAPEFPVGDDTSTDFPGFQAIHVMSARAADVLGDLIEGRVELLPLDVEGGGELYAVNVLRESDALDEEASEFKYFPDSPRIMRIVRHVFDPERLAGETIFQLAQLPEGRACITDPFVNRVRETGLRGLDLDNPVWTAADR